MIRQKQQQKIRTATAISYKHNNEGLTFVAVYFTWLIFTRKGELGSNSMAVV
jgi:hypothetical protein